MALDGINNVQGKTYRTQEDFNTFADRLNKSFPDKTTTVEEKNRAISAKERIIAHKDCPLDVKIALQNEINIIKEEIAKINHEKAMNTSIFGNRTDLE